ncbi:MAG: biotin transporter BioY [Gemmatimonadetes bacterium]|nr:biotin transporter BioY [Gemmatimonadota bacterium]
MIETEATSSPVIAEADPRGAAVFAAVRSWPRSITVPFAVLLFALLTALSARLSVPLGVTPVPMTLQTLVVLLAGALLGPVAGAASQLTYLALGIAGVPVFAFGGAGLPWIFGATGGYLMAFPMAAMLTGWIAGRERGTARTLSALVAGSVVIFAMGAAWLAVVTNMDLRAVFMAGVQPFLPGALIKIAIAFVVVRQAMTRGLLR